MNNNGVRLIEDSLPCFTYSEREVSVFVICWGIPFIEAA
jgi:hypothetical protein